MKYGFLICFAILALSSCLKDDPFIDVSNTQPIIEFSYGSNGSSTLGNFGTNATVEELDTALGLNIASPQVLDYPVTVTLKIDTSYIGKYNAQGGLQLNALPDSTYRFDTTTITIPAGHRIGRIPITLYPSKIDPGPSYGLPITIVSATGPSGQNLIVSGNRGVAYFSFIGNPLAGAYNWNWHRWNAGDSTSVAINPISFDGEQTLFGAVDPTTVEVASGYYSQPRYELTFTNNNGILSNFSVSLNQDDVDAGFTPNGIIVTSGPTILKADPILGVFEFTYTVSSGGAPRYFNDIYYK